MNHASDPKWNQAVAFLKAAAHPVRLSILRHLMQGAKCVQDVQQIVSTSQPNLSQHLAILRKAGLVGCRSNGSLRCYYLLRPPLVETLLRELTKDPPGVAGPRDSVLQNEPPPESEQRDTGKE